MYEIAAKAYIDLEKYDLALHRGRNSLALLPENPLLSVPLANVQASQSLYAEANRNAADALRDLDRFGRPSSIPEKEWPGLERQLRASCFFALARAAVSEALAGAQNQKRTELLTQSTEFLSQARTFNPRDPEIPYLLGLSYLSLGSIESAAVNFLVANKIEGLLQTAALQQLRQIYQSSHEKTESFNTFLERVERKALLLRADDQASSIRAGSLASPPQKTERALRRDYAGSIACRPCHTDQYAAWENTGMSRMFRPYRPENVIGDFHQPWRLQFALAFLVVIQEMGSIGRVQRGLEDRSSLCLCPLLACPSTDLRFGTNDEDARDNMQQSRSTTTRFFLIIVR